MSLLDPVVYPGAIKAFAKEVCRNDLLNYGRLHFFFPDSRLSLDLNTDKALKAGTLWPADLLFAAVATQACSQHWTVCVQPAPCLGSRPCV